IEDVEAFESPSHLGGGRGYTASEADASAVVPDFFEEEELPDFSEVELPEEIKAFLAHEARQINDGLRGKTS
ncbi:MAG: hypothetical protein PHE27_09365, partial [Alphaproteobacteria bacterium]|nr:hypothetical protein [Alphaproteobacteria bacterium]